jgi:hypothetical protein
VPEGVMVDVGGAYEESAGIFYGSRFANVDIINISVYCDGISVRIV